MRKKTLIDFKVGAYYAIYAHYGAQDQYVFSIRKCIEITENYVSLKTLWSSLPGDKHYKTTNILKRSFLPKRILHLNSKEYEAVAITKEKCLYYNATYGLCIKNKETPHGQLQDKLNKLKTVFEENKPIPTVDVKQNSIQGQQGNLKAVFVQEEYMVVILKDIRFANNSILKEIRFASGTLSNMTIMLGGVLDHLKELVRIKGKK